MSDSIPDRQQLAGHRLRDYDHLIASLDQARKSKRITQAGIAGRLGTTQTTVSRWLNGSRLGPANLPFDLADALGYDLALIPRDTEPAPPACGCPVTYRWTLIEDHTQECGQREFTERLTAYIDAEYGNTEEPK